MATETLTNTEIDKLSTQGIREGDVVPGKGTLSPSGTIIPFNIPQQVEPPVSVVSSTAAENKTADNIAKLDEIRKGLEQARQMALNIQKGINESKSTTTTTTPKQSNVYGSVAESEQALKDKASGTTTTTSQYSPEIQASLDQLDTEYNTYANQLDTISARSNATTQALIESIKTTYTNRKAQMEDINMRTLGGLTTAGIRSGRARYAPEIQTGILSTAEREGVRRLSELDVEELNLIAQAERAQTDKDYEILQDRMDMIEKTRESKRQLLQDLFSQSMEQEKLALDKSREQRLGLTSMKDEAERDLTNLVESGLSISDSDAENLGTRLGLSGDVVKSMYDVKRDIFTATTEGDIASAQNKMLNFLQDIPLGQKINLGGYEYTGIGNNNDYYTVQQVDDNGNASVVNYNKRTGEYTVTNIGNIGKSKTDIYLSGGLPSFSSTQQQDIIAIGADILNPINQNEILRNVSKATDRLALMDYLKSSNDLDISNTDAVSAKIKQWIDLNLSDNIYGISTEDEAAINKRALEDL